MTTPIQPAPYVPATQATANTQLSEKIQEFYEWFSPLAMVSSKPTGSSPAPAAAVAGSAGSAPTTEASSNPPAHDPASSLFDSSVTGENPNGSINIYNPSQFATAATAQAMAKLIGGTVQAENLSGPLTRTAPEYDIVGAGANPLNAGLVADLFSKYGEAPGSCAWQVIDSDLGRTQS